VYACSTPMHSSGYRSIHEVQYLHICTVPSASI
jgi:hypothetical protein